MLNHPVGQVAEGIGRELDIRVQDKVVVAGQLRQDGIVAGAEAAVGLPAAHLYPLTGQGAEDAVPHGRFQPCTAAVGAGVVHQIEGQRVAAGIFKHCLRRPERFVAAVINNNTGGKVHGVFPFYLQVIPAAGSSG